jgi:signal transduction histidine kinase
LPIGEKGIGRFGVHKLGEIIELTTKAKDCDEVYVRIDWSEFDSYKYLDEVPIKIIKRSSPQLFIDGRTGTNILIRRLRKKWERGIAREVKRSITALASPFDSDDSFTPNFNIVDKPAWFEGLLNWEDIKDYSLFRFKVIMNRSLITHFEYQFTPWSTMTKLFPRDIHEDEPLVNTFLTLRYQEGDKKDEIINLSNYEIGTVVFEGYIFDQDPFVLRMGVADKLSFKKYLKLNGGVKVFRDKLRVYDYGEPENDWLGLDYRRFQQPSKRISNNNLLGSVSLVRKDSSSLIEKTNREGFVENESYHALRNSLIHTISLVETLRESDKRRLRQIYGPTPKSSPVMSTLNEAKQYIEEKVIDSEVKNQIIKYFNKIESDYKTISENLLKAAGAGLSMSVVIHEVEKIIYEVDKVLKAEKASERVLLLVKHLSSLIDGYAEIIRKSNQSSENVVQIIDQSLFNTEYRLNAHKIDVQREYKLYKGSAKVKIAKNLLTGSIMNIIDNAIYWLDQREFKAIEKGEIFNKQIYIDLIEEENYINIIVADNGTGFLIPTDDVTEPFVSAKPGGMGLGLHIANEIMEAQKGRLIFPQLGDFEIPKEFEKGAIVVFALKK